MRVMILPDRALVVASTLSYACYLLYSGEVVQRIGAMRLAGWASAVACVLCLLQFILLRQLGEVGLIPPPVLWLSLVNGTLCTVVPVLMVMMAIERIGSSKAAHYGMARPVTIIAMGVLILHEPFTAWVASTSACTTARLMPCSCRRWCASTRRPNPSRVSSVCSAWSTPWACPDAMRRAVTWLKPCAP